MAVKLVISKQQLAQLRQYLGRHVVSILLLVIALACLGVGTRMLAMRILHTTITHAPNAQQTITEDTDEPDEVPVTASQAQKYTVPSDQPRSITLPSIQTYALLQRVGLTSDNAIAVPTNIFFAGWYVNSPKPGEQGVSIIDGHVSGRYNGGIFKRLKDMKPHDTIIVEYGDKSVRNFQVVSVTKVPEAEASAALFQQEPGISQQLDLITCGGKFDYATKTFADRIIVVAKTIS